MFSRMFVWNTSALRCDDESPPMWVSPEQGRPSALADGELRSMRRLPAGELASVRAAWERQFFASLNERLGARALFSFFFFFFYRDIRRVPRTVGKLSPRSLF